MFKPSVYPEVNDIHEALASLSDNKKREILLRFFKTGKGEYGEGDEFMGVTVPQIRGVARHFGHLSFDVLDGLLRQPIHDMRLCALIILVGMARKGVTKEMLDFYLLHTDCINNWDLVDCSAPAIVGRYLEDKPRDLLDRLAASPVLWENRIAMVATLHLIRLGQLEDTYRLALRLMGHPHDLIHKATGWMLREAGKRDEGRLVDFVEAHRAEMPRTMLRYAIEKLSPGERRRLMRRD